MNYFHFLLLLLFYYQASDNTHRRAAAQEIITCTTPNGTPGECVPVKRCPPIHELLKKVLDNATTAFLKQSLCGPRGEKSPKVCCDVNGILSETSRSEYPVQTIKKPSNTSPTTSKDYSICGKSGANSIKMSNLEDGGVGFWPWAAVLGYRRGNDPTTFWNCDGSLISDKWVLTAGHCVDGTGDLRLAVVRMGEVHLDETVNDEASPVDMEVKSIILHPQFSNYPLTNDIALLRLKNTIIFSEKIRPVCLFGTDLYKGDEFYEKKGPFIAGWRYTQFGGSSSKMLRHARYRMVNRELCAKTYKPGTRSPIDIRSLCVERFNDEDCRDDTGGALLIPIKASFNLAGIRSFGGGCANPDYPAVYTKVAHYSDWIRNVTGIKF